MKSKTVDYITSNEEHARLRIYDGEIALDDAGRYLVGLYRAQAEAAEARERFYRRAYRNAGRPPEG